VIQLPMHDVLRLVDVHPDKSQQSGFETYSTVFPFTMSWTHGWIFQDVA
jgi:hypothetical protein